VLFNHFVMKIIEIVLEQRSRPGNEGFHFTVEQQQCWSTLHL